MSVEIEGLEFQIESDSDKAAKGIDALVESFEKLKKALKSNTGSDKFSEKLEAISKATDKLTGTETLENLANSLNQLSNVKISSTIAKRLTEISAAVNTITSTGTQNVSTLASALQNMQGVQIPNVSGGQTTTGTTSVGTGTSYAAATSGMTQYTQSVSTANIATNGFMSTLRNLGGVFSSAFSALGGTALKGLKSGLTGITSAAKAAVNAGKNLGTTFGSKLASRVKQITSGFGQLFSSLKRIAMYRAVRFFLSQLTQAMKEGINNLYQYSALMGGTFKSSMDSLATSFQYLKNSMGAMVAPIINAVAPAVDYLIDKFVSLINVINRFVAALTGASTYTVAKKAATTYADTLEDTASSASSAAKEITDAVTGIDELNIISQNDNTGSGSGSSDSTDYASMFEEISIPTAVSDFANQLREAFLSGDWESLGTLLGEKVNEVVDSIDWSGIGSKIGYALNGIIQTAYWFLDTVDFTNIGNRIAELFNAAIGEIDWSYAGRLIVKGLTILSDIIIGGFTGLDWGLIARSVSDFIIGAFNELTDWFKGYSWANLGSQLWQSLKDIVTNIDYSGIASSMFTALGTALGSAVSFIWGFISSIAIDIWNWFKTEIVGQNWLLIPVNILAAIGQGFLNIGSWVLENIVDPFISALFDAEWWSAAEEIISYLWDGFVSGVKAFFSNPLAFIKENIVDPFINGIKSLFGIASPSTVMAEIGGYIVEGLYNGIKNLISSGLSIITGWASSVFNWFTGGDGSGNIFQKFAGAASNIVSYFGNKISSVYTSVKDKVTTWASGVYNWFTGGDGNGSIFQKFTTAAGSIITGFANKVSSAYTNAKTSITTWAAKIKDWFTDENSTSSWTTIAGNIISGFTSGISSLAGSVKNTITGLASNVAGWFKSALGISSPSKLFYEFGDNTVSGFNNAIESVGRTTKSVMTSWTDSFTDISPTMNIGVDTSSLDYYDSDDFAKAVLSNVEASADFTSDGFKQAMEDFYHDYLETTLLQIAEDTRRQADKEEQTVVKVSGRELASTLKSQTKANGYSFAT